MDNQHIKGSFAEIRELRDEADEKEKMLIKRLEEEGMLSALDTILLSSGIIGFGGKDNGKMLETLVLECIEKRPPNNL